MKKFLVLLVFVASITHAGNNGSYIKSESGDPKLDRLVGAFKRELKHGTTYKLELAYRKLKTYAVTHHINLPIFEWCQELQPLEHEQQKLQFFAWNTKEIKGQIGDNKPVMQRGSLFLLEPIKLEGES